jgi:AcrR family transcriptional regulator
MTQNKQSPTSNQTRANIMNAASQLFGEKGYAGSTTREIADLAGVNEVTIFRHFGSKQKLARAIMDQFGGLAIAEKMKANLTGDYQDDLLFIGQTIMKVMKERVDVMRMAICEAGNFPEFQEIVAENPRQLRLMLSSYLAEQMEQGVVLQNDPETLAQAFLGMFFSYVVLEGFLGETLESQEDPEEITHQFVELFIHGTMVDQE